MFSLKIGGYRSKVDPHTRSCVSENTGMYKARNESNEYFAFLGYSNFKPVVVGGTKRSSPTRDLVLKEILRYIVFERNCMLIPPNCNVVYNMQFGSTTLYKGH